MDILQFNVHPEQEVTASRMQEPVFSFPEAELRDLGYQVIDEFASYLTHIQERPVWQSMPDEVRRRIRL